MVLGKTAISLLVMPNEQPMSHIIAIPIVDRHTHKCNASKTFNLNSQ